VVRRPRCRRQGGRDLPVVVVAAVIGSAGNELAARYRIRVGRKIGSAALVADRLHARTDGFTALAVLLGVGGSRWAGTGPTRSSGC
jgi:divalent metal cation (Fe/Co/Zn/Cd) transporter